MSAFIVDNTLINRIVSAISSTMLGHSQSIPRPYSPALCETEPKVLGQKLRELNELAVKQRYPDWELNGLPGPVDEQGNTPDYRYSPVAVPTAMQLYKDLRCLLYQCSEGDIPYYQLYKELEEYKADVADRILVRLPEFERASWG